MVSEMMRVAGRAGSQQASNAEIDISLIRL